MKKYILPAIIIFSIGYALKDWAGCQRFPDQYHFSTLDLSLRLIEAIHNDGGVPLLLVRIFHNKVLGPLIDTFRIYSLYWDPRFLVTLISPLGLSFCAVGVYTLLKEKTHRKLRGIPVLLFLFPFFMIFRLPVPFLVWSIGYAALLSVMALYGVMKIPLSRWSIIFVSSILILGLWWGTVYTPTLLEFCTV